MELSLHYMSPTPCFTLLSRVKGENHESDLRARLTFNGGSGVGMGILTRPARPGGNNGVCVSARTLHVLFRLKPT